MIVADVTLTSDGQKVKSEENLQLGVRAARLDGIPLMTLDKVLKGAKPGDTRKVDCEIPDDYERADLRGKKGSFEFTVHEVKRLQPLANDALIAAAGAKDEAELRSFVKEDMEAERDRLIERAKREQVNEYLLRNVQFDVPQALSARQTDRAVMRRVIELQQAGVPDSEIEARIDELRTRAGAEVLRDLKLDFILAKVAEKLQVSISEEEVNTEIARIARLYNRRFDRVRDDLAKRGLLMQLAEGIRHEKCVARLLEDAKISA
jgi:trigger factor